MIRNLWVVVLVFLTLAGIVGCGKSDNNEFANIPPVANAGPDQSVVMGSLVTLDGSASNDADSRAITYTWNFVSVPTGSTLTQLTGTTTVSPSFTPDVDGDYVIQLIVNNGFINSLPDSVTITASSSSWQPAQSVDSRLGDLYVDLAMNPSGQAVAVWRNDSPSGSSILASHYDSLTDAWSVPELLKNQGLEVDQPRVAISRFGHAVAVWVQYEASGISIWANYYNPVSKSWGIAQPIVAASLLMSRPQVAINGDGNAIAVWEQYDGGDYNLCSNTYTTGSGWGTAAIIESSAGNAVQGQVALDESGKAVIVWIEDPNNYNYKIKATTFDFASATWGTEATIDPTDTVADYASYASLEPKIAMDADGNAFVAWILQDFNQGQRNNIWTIRYNTVTGIWGNAAEVDGTDDTSSMQQLAVDTAGNCIVVWSQFDEILQLNNVATNRFDVISGAWTGPVLLESDSGIAVYPFVSMDGNGNAIVVWKQHNGSSYDIRSSARNTSGDVWSAPRLISTGVSFAGINDDGMLQVFVSSTDSALAVWFNNGIWSSTFK